MQNFGKGARRRGPVRREPFTFTFLRDETPEVHTFQARAVGDVVSLATVLSAAQNNPEAAMPSMLRLIAKMLDNKDGTPYGWKAEALPLPERAEQPEQQWNTTGGMLVEVVDQDDEEPQERKFRGPDGGLHTYDKLDQFEAFDAGSSRRRWQHLMDVDDDVEVEYRDLTELFEWLVGLAAGRPTQASS
jgi:hypothetical protein